MTAIISFNTTSLESVGGVHGPAGDDNQLSSCGDTPADSRVVGYVYILGVPIHYD